MGSVKVGSNCCCLQLHSRHSSSSSSSSSHSLASIFSSISSKSCKTTIAYNNRSPFLGSNSSKLSRRRSLDDFRSVVKRSKQKQKQSVLRRASSACLDNSFNDNDEEFTNLIRDSIIQEPANWIEMKANSVDLPLSLRIIKQKKKKNKKHFEDQDSGSECCSVKKAFSSMVFMVREIQSYMLQMREDLYYENLQGILARVQEEMNASFVWLFQQIFSCTPTLMMYVMLLLANFTVHSIGDYNSVAMAAINPPVLSIEQDYQQNQRYGVSTIKSYSTTCVGGRGNGGGNVKPVAGATEDGGAIISDEIVTAKLTEEEEQALWDKIVDEATMMQASTRDEALMDPDTLSHLVSPIKVESESEQGNYLDYLHTELMYHQALSQDPDNVLLLSNFAQFLFLVLHDHDRAHRYFKRAAEVKPADAEALNRYATFLWLARNDLEAAEATYLEAIEADPSNSYSAANYAHFLWNTGGEDTFFRSTILTMMVVLGSCNIMSIHDVRRYVSGTLTKQKGKEIDFYNTKRQEALSICNLHKTWSAEK